MYIRLLFKRPLKLVSVAIFVSHNHPSRKLEPSNVDKQIVQKIKNPDPTLDIKLLNHLIITEKDYFSLHKDSGKKKHKYYLAKLKFV